MRAHSLHTNKYVILHMYKLVYIKYSTTCTHTHSFLNATYHSTSSHVTTLSESTTPRQFVIISFVRAILFFSLSIIFLPCLPRLRDVFTNPSFLLYRVVYYSHHHRVFCQPRKNETHPSFAIFFFYLSARKRVLLNSLGVSQTFLVRVKHNCLYRVTSSLFSSKSLLSLPEKQERGLVHSFGFVSCRFIIRIPAIDSLFSKWPLLLWRTKKC